MVIGPEKVELDFVRHKKDQDDFILVNRAASRLPDDAAKQLKLVLYSLDGAHLSVLAQSMLQQLKPWRRGRRGDLFC